MPGFRCRPKLKPSARRKRRFTTPPPAVAGAEDEPVEAGPVESPGPPRRSIDESVLAVLREEAEREAEARKAEAPPVVETQTEMGLVPRQGGCRAAWWRGGSPG